MPLPKLPPVSWAAAVWSVPVATCGCLTVIAFLAVLQPSGSKPLTFPLLCMLVGGLSLGLWFGARTPKARGIALGIVGVPFVLAWVQWLIR